LHWSEPKLIEKSAVCDSKLLVDRKISTEQLYLELKQKSNELNEILTSL
jgi:ribonuclease HIII